MSAAEKVEPQSESTKTPTDFLGWESRVELRLARLEKNDERIEEKLDNHFQAMLGYLQRPPFMERCGKWMIDLVTLTITRLTAPDSIKYTAITLIVAAVLFAGATFQGWGVTIGR